MGYYKDARAFLVKINKFFTTLLKEEKYALINQVKRALNSIIFNIAEGTNKNTDKDMRVYINQGYCSLDEVIICLDYILDGASYEVGLHKKLINYAPH
ncbi:MAG: hypothetical protein DDT41_01741 [candidate division WS2 bacterium]|nr:hypothetical protein [Candidatus Psychracetigena formicireducens]